MAYTQIDKMVKRQLTKTESALLSTMMRSNNGIGNEQIVSLTTPTALPTHIAKLRGALADGYQIKRSNNRYMLVEHDTQAVPEPVDVTPVIVEVAPVVESEPVAEVDHVAAIRERLQTKLDALKDDHMQKTAAFHSLGKQIDTLSAQIADVENSLHVLTDHIALHVAA